MARILITGATGSLGRRVAARAVAGGHTVLGTHVRPRRRAPAVTDGKPGGIGAWARLDICDLDAVREVVAAFRPDIVVHTAAGRDRNDWAPTARGAANVALACVALSNGGADSRCREVIPGLAAARWSRGALDAGEAAADSVRGAAVTSGDAVESIVAAAALPGRVRLVHVSSDAIFSGRAGREYTEGDQPDPTYPYGAAKAAAETAVAAIDPSAAIVRTSLILGDGNGAHERLTHDLVAGRVDGALFVDEIRKTRARRRSRGRVARDRGGGVPRRAQRGRDGRGQPVRARAARRRAGRARRRADTQRDHLGAAG